MANLTQFGNDLYTGKRSYDFVGKYRLWYMIAIVGMAISIVIPIVNGFNFGIEFLAFDARTATTPGLALPASLRPRAEVGP